MMSQSGYQRDMIHILLNIPHVKGNQTMKIDQLIEYPKINIFLRKIGRK